MEKVLLIDGTNFIFRAYYATAYSKVGVLRNSKGFPTNGLYSYINMLNKQVKEEKADYVIVAFDKGKTFRHEAYKDYKAGRRETPEDLKLQMPYAKRLVNAMGYSLVEVDNYEADDIIGTYAEKLKDKYEIVVVSSDKDLLQLIDKNVYVKHLGSKASILYDAKALKENMGVEPLEIIDLKALMGDPSDNIPGVKGIGEKTALDLLKKYDGLDGIYEHIDEIKGARKEKLLEGKEDAYKSKELATICRDVNIPINLAKAKNNGVNPEYISLLEELEFNSLLSSDIKQKESDLSYKVIKEFNIKEDYAIFPLKTGLNFHKSSLLGLAISTKSNNYFISKENITEEIFTSKYFKYTYDLKGLIVLASKLGYKVKDAFDLFLSAYLLNEEIDVDISILASSKNKVINSFKDIYKKDKYIISDEELIYDSISKARFIYDESVIEEEKINSDKSLKKLLYDVEIPLTRVLAKMEIKGVKTSFKVLDSFSLELKNELEKLEKEIYKYAGEEFNILSPKQLGSILFEKLEVPYPRKVKNNTYSTDKDVLYKIRHLTPIAPLVEEYRKNSKLLNTYLNSLKEEIGEDGRIHTTFNQALTRTGRLSSSDPNLQNIPVRDELGRKLRKAFVSEKGFTLLSADYSQVELRIFADLSNNHSMIEAFNKDLDIHSYTASIIFDKDIKDLSKSDRREAKAVNFGIIYGISPYGLSEDLDISVSKADEFIKNYLAKFPGIKNYMDDSIKEAKEKGYSETILGRKRMIPELSAHNFLVRKQGERMALNTPIQGSSADILKLAMIKLDKSLEDSKLESKMILQVHDELILEVKDVELSEVKKLVKDAMENTYKLKVPLKVDISSASNWYEV